MLRYCCYAKDTGTLRRQGSFHISLALSGISELRPAVWSPVE